MQTHHEEYLLPSSIPLGSQHSFLLHTCQIDLSASYPCILSIDKLCTSSVYHYCASKIKNSFVFVLRISSTYANNDGLPNSDGFLEYISLLETSSKAFTPRCSIMKIYVWDDETQDESHFGIFGNWASSIMEYKYRSMSPLQHSMITNTHAHVSEDSQTSAAIMRIIICNLLQKKFDMEPFQNK